MPIEFLSDEQAVGYARFLGEPTREQLERFFWLNDADLARIGRRRRDATALGYAVQLGTAPEEQWNEKSRQRVYGSPAFQWASLYDNYFLQGAAGRGIVTYGDRDRL